jgi:hypothetical protein
MLRNFLCMGYIKISVFDVQIKRNKQLDHDHNISLITTMI